jgi:hypothetical protein
VIAYATQGQPLAGVLDKHDLREVEIHGFCNGWGLIEWVLALCAFRHLRLYLRILCTFLLYNIRRSFLTANVCTMFEVNEGGVI